MTKLDGDSISGRFSGNDRKSQLSRNNQDYRKKAIGKYLPTFSKSKTLLSVPTEDDPNYLKIIAHTISDPQWIVDGILVAIDRYHKIGHYDEEVAAQLAAFDASVQAQFKVIGNLIPMHILHDVLSNPPTDEANATDLSDGTQALVKIALYDRDTLSTILTNMENLKLEVLPLVVEILKLLFFLCEITPEEKIGGVYSPGENIVFGLPKDILTTHETNVATIATNKGKFRKFCNFYGVKTVPFKAEMVTNYRTLKGYNSIIEYFKYYTMAFYDAAAHNTLHHAAETFLSATQKLYWKDSPEENVDEMMALHFAVFREVDHNPYGSLVVELTATTQNNVNIVVIYQDDDSQGAANGFDARSLSEDPIARLFAKFASAHYVSGATFGLAFCGTDLTSDQIIAEPSYIIDNGVNNSGILSSTIMKNAMLIWLSDKLGLSPVKKGGK